MINNVNASRDAKTLHEIALRVANATRGEMGQEFGKPMSNLSGDTINRITDMITKEVFGSELNAIAENKSLTGTNASVNSFKEELIKKFKDMYTTAAENSIFRYTQNTGHYVTNLGTVDQLHLVSLIAGIIQATYNVIFKTHVEKGLTFTREMELPYAIIDGGRRMIDYFDLVNNAANIRSITNMNSPTSTVEFAITNDKVTGNIIKEYNDALLAADPNSSLITGPYDFLNRGVQIVAVEEGGNKIDVTHISTGYATQSGQRSDVIAVLNAVFSDKEIGATKTIKVAGSVRLNGNIELFTSGGITKIWIKFNIPAIGPKKPISFSTRKTPIVVQIGKSFSTTTTLNEQFKEHHALVLGADIIEEFHKYSTTAVNMVKDTYAFDYIDSTIDRLEKNVSRPLDNFETTLTKNRTFAHVEASASSANFRFETLYGANESMLAQAMFKATNQLEIALNPKERRYIIYSSSAAAQWVKEADGSSFNKLQQVSDMSDQYIAGLSLPYSMQKIKIGGHATGYFISTNNKKDYTKTVKTTYTPISGVQVKDANTDKHRYIIKTDYEATLDTYLFLQGPEYVEQGTGTDAYPVNNSLQLETMYDMTAFNESIGVVDFTELPLIIKP